MDRDIMNKLTETLLEASRSHPLFAGLEPGKMADFAAGWSRALQAMMAPTPAVWGDWVRTWSTYQSDLAGLWLAGVQGETATTEPSKDRRFGDDAWNEGVFPLLRQSYELAAKAMVDLADKAGLPAEEQRKLSFYARVTADGLSPSNFALTNPEVLKLARDTGGQSLVEGFRNMLEDLRKGYITTTDEAAFEVGGNLATTRGAVVFRNELIELIQYAPTTPEVRTTPILIVPPCVNKFYIFDINEKKSMIRYLVDQGNSVFVISWRNAGPETRDYDWNDYIAKGVMTAIDATTEIARSETADLLSWCNGGTLLLAALAVMPEPQKSRVASATFLSTMLDFSDAGEVEVFLDAPQIEAYRPRLDSAGVAPGRDIARAMAMLHVNESIWGFVVNNYLKGQNPPPSDILYWNADTSNLPKPWYSYFVEQMYDRNKLKQPGALTLLGKPVDCGNIDVPCYFVAATGDHIVPWKTSFGSTRLMPNVTEFVLTSGGHVSSTVINHPEGSRRSFVSGGDANASAEAWRESARQTQGSWWPHWLDWLNRTSGSTTRAAPKGLGDSTHPELAAAPGTYVKEKVPQDG